MMTIMMIIMMKITTIKYNKNNSNNNVKRSRGREVGGEDFRGKGKGWGRTGRGGARWGRWRGRIYYAHQPHAVTLSPAHPQPDSTPPRFTPSHHWTPCTLLLSFPLFPWTKSDSWGRQPSQCSASDSCQLLVNGWDLFQQRSPSGHVVCGFAVSCWMLLCHCCFIFYY